MIIKLDKLFYMKYQNDNNIMYMIVEVLQEQEH